MQGMGQQGQLSPKPPKYDKKRSKLQMFWPEIALSLCPNRWVGGPVRAKEGQS